MTLALMLGAMSLIEGISGDASAAGVFGVCAVALAITKE